MEQEQPTDLWERDIFKMLEKLNEEGFRKIDEAFYDPKNEIPYIGYSNTWAP